MTTFELYLHAIEEAPNLKPIFVKCAQRAVNGEAQPKAMTFRDMSYDDERVLAEFFGLAVDRLRDGRVRIRTPDKLREPTAWTDIVSHLGIRPKEESDNTARNTIRRAKLLFRNAFFVDYIPEYPEIMRFLKDPDNSKAWLTLLNWLGSRLTPISKPITLSQLGSDLFGDSKILRSGTLRRQLILLLKTFEEGDISDEKTLLGKYGIIDNPFTTHVTVFAPFLFQLADGTSFDYPKTLFEKGMACQLPLETISRIDRVYWMHDNREIITSENAAPFAEMVHDGIPCLYTEGYPNMAVKGLLREFAKNNVTATHEGDADLDGLRIAEEVSECIFLNRVIAAEILATPPDGAGIPMTDDQQARLDSFMNKCDPTYPMFESYQRLQSLGRWFEQESYPRASLHPRAGKEGPPRDAPQRNNLQPCTGREGPPVSAAHEGPPRDAPHRNNSGFGAEPRFVVPH